MHVVRAARQSLKRHALSATPCGLERYLWFPKSKLSAANLLAELPLSLTHYHTALAFFKAADQIAFPSEI